MAKADARQTGRAAIWRRMQLACAASLCLAAPAALSQTASSVTPDSFQPQLQDLGGSVVFSGNTGTQAPPGSDQIGITLSGVTLEGAFPQMAAANAGFEQRLTRGRIPVSELFEASSELEAAYAQAGFVLARVVLPQQSLRDGGVLRVSVIDGFVEAIDTSRTPPEIRRRIDTLTGPLLERKSITLAQLERQLLLAGDVSGVALGSALATGQRPGGTVIALEPEFRRITGFVGFDNFAPPELGSIAPDDLHGLVLNSGFELNSLLGYGETVYGRLSASPKGVLSSDPRYRVLALGGVMPIGSSGLALNLELTTSDTTPDTDEQPTRSDFDRQSFRLIYPWIRSRQMNLTSQLMLDRQTDEMNLRTSGLPAVFRDQLTVLRFGTSLAYTHQSGSFSEAGVVLSRGIDAFGARTAEDAAGTLVPLSRQGADATFTKIVGSATHQRALGERFALSMTGRFQTAFGDPLLTSEQFSIAGPNELSAFDSGDLRGDSGWVLRAELSHPRSVELRGTPFTLSPYAFAGVGEVSIERPTAVEASSESAHAIGIGLDLVSQTGSRFRSNSLRIEYGRGERDHGSDNSRVSLSGNFRF
ncbi:ShlB/FhaC/HecB family hemolysin secretion/activation protein [Paracoccus zhejiangensis]|uniref:ShlB/FhaC/HecB family hemolysin secretion/activation protein n=1 Tax=Paracoccus zhejiangensis TaxID=1077935 RepID=A0A2H5F4R2_9RHOB|nr:ShlB/FhaC/HecB family hemolysin secretion/activation protein [Paracoccus zhejiangensis]AUH66539.1 ShlB/FhaC/HecB family hemolysin secretion/activation protein [Paracoccus zhejiangensis]